MGSEYKTLDAFDHAPTPTKLRLLAAVAESLRALHAVGIVHADVKPEHIDVENEADTLKVRLIDFDSGFVEIAPPEAGKELAIDPVYLSPEAYRMITGKNIRLSRKADTFALGILIHQTLAGSLPGFDRARYGYPYAAVLDGAKLSISETIGAGIGVLIRKMLKKRPAFRPGDDQVVHELKKQSL
ncbi:MAG: hypothetical protein IH607_06050 [Firmicutes bacterium]|nr:hypothetical protein [Bacillota bacterium]